MKEVDNLYYLKFGINLLAVPSGVSVIKTTGNIGMYSPHVFLVMSGTSQSYYPKYSWERLSPPYTGSRR